MRYTLLIREEAREEIAQAYEWYEENNGIGDRFLSALREQHALIQHNPYQFPIKYKLFRTTLLNYFPYHIIYEVVDNCITVYSFFHASRHPNA